MSNKFWNRAFTVAELLTVIVVIGVVAAITIGVLRYNTSDLEQRVAKAKMMDSVSTALGTMQLDERLAGYANTQEFAAQFATYYDAAPLSAQEVAKLESSFPQEALNSLGETPVYLKTSSGEVLAISYNPNYTPSSNYVRMAKNADTSATDSVEFRNEALGALSGFYDINGINNGPNKIGEDINLIQPYVQNQTGIQNNCKGNYLLDPAGGGCICPVSANECVSMGKTFDADNCACVANCPVGKEFSEEVGACICVLNANSCVAPYSEFDAESCTCKATVGASAKCVDNGGVWDATAGNCVCRPATDENSCEFKSNGYAFADKANFCKCSCKTTEQIKNDIKTKAKNRGDYDKVLQYTVPTSDVENGCVYCAAKPLNETSYDIVLEDGICKTKPLVEKNPLCVEPFCVWQDYNEKNPNDSYYNKCIINQNACNAILNEAHVAEYGYEARTNTCMTDSSDACRKNVNECIKNPKSSACKNGLKNCSSRTSTPHYSCAMKYAWGGSVANGGLSPVNGSKGKIGPAANATVDNCYCGVKQGVMNASVPRTYYFHGASGIYEANRFTKFTGYDMPAFKGAYMDTEKLTPSKINNVMVLETYDSWYDPIVLNVNNPDAFAVPKTTDALDVQFKDEEGKDILTAWIARYITPTYYFLVNDLNNDGQVNDLNELYSEVGGYVTGLQMLNDDFADYITKTYKVKKDDVASTKALIGYPELARKGLKTWADMNSNAKVDAGDVFEDVLVLTAVEKTRDILVKEEKRSYNWLTNEEEVIAPAKYKTETYYEFSDISGTGIFEIYTGYTMLSSTAGTPERSGNSTVAIQSKYSILKPISQLSNNKQWIKMVPTQAGKNPDVEYQTTDFRGDVRTVSKNVNVYQDFSPNLSGVNKLVWKYDFGLYNPNKEIGIYIDVNGQLYEVQVRGLTDIIFDKI